MQELQGLFLIGFGYFAATFVVFVSHVAGQNGQAALNILAGIFVAAVLICVILSQFPTKRGR